ncbi:MAG: hypothetical protein ACPG5B_06690 [Chitinophagales bacterium]
MKEKNIVAPQHHPIIKVEINLPSQVVTFTNLMVDSFSADSLSIGGKTIKRYEGNVAYLNPLDKEDYMMILLLKAYNMMQFVIVYGMLQFIRKERTIKDIVSSFGSNFSNSPFKEMLNNEYLRNMMDKLSEVGEEDEFVPTEKKDIVFSKIDIDKPFIIVDVHSTLKEQAAFKWRIGFKDDIEYRKITGFEIIRRIPSGWCLDDNADLSLLDFDAEVLKEGAFHNINEEAGWYKVVHFTDFRIADTIKRKKIVLDADLFDVLLKCGRYYGTQELYSLRFEDEILFVNRETLEERVGRRVEFSEVEAEYLDFENKDIKWSEFGALKTSSVNVVSDFGFDSHNDFWKFYSKKYESNNGSYYLGIFDFTYKINDNESPLIIKKANDNLVPLSAELAQYPFLVFNANLDKKWVGGCLNFQGGTQRMITRIEKVSYENLSCYIEKKHESQWDDFDDRLLDIGAFVKEPKKREGIYSIVHFTDMTLGEISLLEIKTNQTKHYTITIAPAEIYDSWIETHYIVYCLPNGLSEINVKGIYKINGPTQDAKVIDNRIVLLENETMFDITAYFLHLLKLDSVEALKKMYEGFDFSKRFEIVHFTNFRFNNAAASEPKASVNLVPLSAELAQYPFLVFNNIQVVTYMDGNYEVGDSLSFSDGTEKTITRIDMINRDTELNPFSDWNINTSGGIENAFDDRLFSLGKIVSSIKDGSYYIVHFEDMVFYDSDFEGIKSDANVKILETTTAEKLAKPFFIRNANLEPCLKYEYVSDEKGNLRRVLSQLFLDIDDWFSLNNEFNYRDAVCRVLECDHAVLSSNYSLNIDKDIELLFFVDLNLAENQIYVNAATFERLQGATAYFLQKTEATKWLPTACHETPSLELVFVNVETGDKIEVVVEDDINEYSLVQGQFYHGNFKCARLIEAKLKELNYPSVERFLNDFATLGDVTYYLLSFI